MSLLSDIEANVIQRGATCKTADILAFLGPNDREDLETAIANNAIPASAIASALRKRGLPIADASINRHRRGDCKCP